MKKNMELMGQIDLMKSITPQEIESYLIEGSCKITQYKKNNIVHFVGEVCSKLEIILSGKVVIERIEESGNLMTIAEFLGGDVLGGNLMFSKNPYYPMTVTAKEATLILEINKDRLFRLFSDNHEFLSSYLEYVSDHTVILGDRIKHYVNRTIRESIISYLNFESKKQNSSIIKLSMTKKALAEKIGVQRTSLSRELAKMREDGLIEFNSVSISLLNKFFE
ncbi:MAG: Crp/Fnr family transcriptional regulator [Christensenella sp.]|uniref:Crp/Fnr family transcriptional regulator n=1 Tax=Christensenella sp. TaxID=1935934 RepID=UPI002B1EA891|nr:Crp/Fnr family transcriptional regulator [Christensenella sp.]MEA5003369.1 Crp/Fnr family transcriptional regulator [Christensenella sp.]